MESFMTRIIVIAAAVLLSSSALAQDKAAQKFLSEAIQGNFAEAQMGELAQKNGQSQEVKSYGQMLVTEHNAANQKAAEVATSIGMTLPAGPSAKQKADFDKMSKMTGAQFDRMFGQHMVKDHKKGIAAYKKASKKQDSIGKYAQDTLPTLQKHLEGAQNLQKQKTSTQ
jgi:putative membrane protein